MNAFYETKNHERRSFRSPPALLGPMLDFDLKEENSCFGSFDFRSYHRFKAISDFIDCIGQSYPDLAKVIDIGKSTEGRPIKVVKLSKPGTKAGRPSIFIEGGIHAREWISPASVLYICTCTLSGTTNSPTFSITMTFTFYLSSIRMGTNTRIPMTGCGEKLGPSKADAGASIQTGILATNGAAKARPETPAATSTVADDLFLNQN